MTKRILYFLLIVFFISNVKSVYKKQPKSEALNKFYFEELKRSFPFEFDFPYNHYWKEIESTKDIIRLSENSDSTIHWQQSGPDHTSGRMLCVAVDHSDTSVLWAGSASGGLWKSEVGGIGTGAWQHIKTGFLVSSFSSIAIHPKNSNIIFSGTGEVYGIEQLYSGKYVRTLRGFPGIGIIMSTNGGKTWKLSLDFKNLKNIGVNRIVFDPLDDSTIYAATTNGLYRSWDLGSNWTQIFDIPFVCDILVHGKNPDKLTISCGGLGCKNYGVYYSSDKGQTWSKITYDSISNREGKIMLSHSLSNPDHIHCLFSDKFETIGYLRTSNFFNTVFKHPCPDIGSYQGWYARGLLVHPTIPSKIIAGGVDLFVDQFAFGNQFQRLYPNEIKVHPDYHDIIYNPLDHNKIYLCTDGGIFRSDDFGKSFYTAYDGLFTTQFYSGDIYSNNIDKFIIGGLQDNQSALNLNRENWTKVGSGDGGPCYFHPTDFGTIYLSSQNSNIYKSTDFGKIWKEILKSRPKSSFISPFCIHPQNGNYILAGSDKLMISKNGGIVWDTLFEDQFGGVISAISFNPKNTNEFIFSTFSTELSEIALYKARLDLKEIVPLHIPLKDRIITDISYHQIENNKILISYSGYFCDHLFSSLDDGNSWQSISISLPDLPIHVAIFHPSNTNTILIGTDAGLYASYNYGLEWYNLTDSDYDIIPVYDIKFINNKGKLGIFTHGNGYFEYTIPENPVISNNSDNISENVLIENITNVTQLDKYKQTTEVGNLISLNGYTQTYPLNELITKWNNLTPGLYYFVSKNVKLKCIIIN